MKNVTEKLAAEKRLKALEDQVEESWIQDYWSKPNQKKMDTLDVKKPSRPGDVISELDSAQSEEEKDVEVSGNTWQVPNPIVEGFDQPQDPQEEINEVK